MKNINYFNQNINNIDNTFINIKSRANEVDGGYLLSLLESLTHNCIQGTIYHQKIKEITNKKFKQIKKSDSKTLIITDQDRIRMLNHIKNKDLHFLKRRIEIAFNQLYNYIIFDSYGAKNKNVVKIYKSLEELQADQGNPNCMGNIDINNLYFELIIGLLLENRLENNININENDTEYIKKQIKLINYEDSSEFENTFNNIINLFKQHIKNIKINKNYITIKDLQKVKQGDYCIVIENEINLYVRDENIWREYNYTQGSELNHDSIHINLIKNKINNIFSLTDYDFTMIINFFNSNNKPKFAKNVKFLFSLYSQYNELVNVLETSEEVSDNINHLYNTINTKLNFYETKIIKKTKKTSVISQTQQYHDKLLSNVFTILNSDFSKGLLALKELINKYGYFNQSDNYIKWKDSNENMLCSH